MMLTSIATLQRLILGCAMSTTQTCFNITMPRTKSNPETQTENHTFVGGLIRLCSDNKLSLQIEDGYSIEQRMYFQIVLEPFSSIHSLQHNQVTSRLKICLSYSINAEAIVNQTLTHFLNQKTKKTFQT